MAPGGGDSGHGFEGSGVCLRRDGGEMETGFCVVEGRFTGVSLLAVVGLGAGIKPGGGAKVEGLGTGTKPTIGGREVGLEKADLEEDGAVNSKVGLPAGDRFSCVTGPEPELGL